MKHAILTVSNDEFIKGTLVLFSSFLKYNKWYEGDFIVVSDEISKESVELLKNIPRLRIIAPGNVLSNRVEKLKQQLPNYKNTYRRFFSLEAFNLKGYDKVLYLDSDMLCLSDAEELFNHSEVISACADHKTILGFSRDYHTFKAIKTDSKQLIDSKALHIKSFNTGLMMIGKKLINESTYLGLCQMIKPEIFEHIQTNQTDTVVLNMTFHDRIHWLDFKYNAYSRLLHLMESRSQKIDFKDIKFLHFLGSEKPWLYLKGTETYPYHKLSLEMWISHYNEVVIHQK